MHQKLKNTLSPKIRSSKNNLLSPVAPTSNFKSADNSPISPIPFLDNVATSPTLHNIHQSSQVSGPYYIPNRIKDKASSTSYTDQDSFVKPKDVASNSKTLKLLYSTNSQMSLEADSTSPGKKLVLPRLSSTTSHDLVSPTIQHHLDDTIAQPNSYYNTKAFNHANDTDFVKQAEYIRSSPHLAKYNQLSSLLSQIEAKKSSLSKELFYYPDQLEANRKLQANAAKRLEKVEDVDLGISVITEGKRQQVNLLEGKSTYFKLNCFRKVLPIKVKIDVFEGSFEFSASRNIKKPDSKKYDFLFSSNEFEVNYKDEEGIKWIYFGVRAMERLTISFIINFKPGTHLSHNTSLPSLNNSAIGGEGRRKKKVYEFFNKDMKPEEVDNLKKMALQIKEERKKKLEALSSNKNIIEENQKIATQYDLARMYQLAVLKQTRDYRSVTNKEARNSQQKAVLNKQICNGLRDEVRKIKTEFETEAEMKRQKLIDFQRDVLTTIALCSIVDALTKKKEKLLILEELKAKITRQVKAVQRGSRAHMSKPLDLREDLASSTSLTVQQSKISLNIYNALNAWIQLQRPSQASKAEDICCLMLEDLLLPLKLVEKSTKFVQTLNKIQTQWREKRIVWKTRIEIFFVYWTKYYAKRMEEERSKPKSASFAFISKISEDTVRPYAEDLVRKRIKVLSESPNAFLILKLRNAKKIVKNQFLTSGDHEDTERISQNPETQENSFKSNNTQEIQTNGDLPEKKRPSRTFLVKPSQQELKDIFDQIVTEFETEY